MQCLNTKIKEEDIVGDAYVGESSSAALSHPSSVAQSKVILSPRIEIHRIVKNHTAAMALTTTASTQNGHCNVTPRDAEIIYDQTTSPTTDNITDVSGPNCGADRIKSMPPSSLPHQFISPPNNCAVLHYREHRTETTSMAMPQQRVHVIKDGRFYSTTTATTSSSPPNGAASATTTDAASVAATGPTATSKNRWNVQWCTRSMKGPIFSGLFPNRPVHWERILYHPEEIFRR